MLIVAEVKITPKSIPPQPQSFAFLTLDGSSKYLRPVKESYWDHVTIDGLSVYENIYDACCDPHTGLVSCKKFPRSVNKPQVAQDPLTPS